MEVLRKLIYVGLLLTATTVQAQLNLFRFATFYASYSTTTPAAEPVGYRVQGIYDPGHQDDYVNGTIVEMTQYSEPNLNITVGIRKIARFNYQVKQGLFYDGSEHEISDYSTVSNAPGLEYLFQYSFVRNRGTEVTQQEYKLRYISNNFTAKAAYVNDGLINLRYTLGEARLRKSFGSFDVTAGVAHRSHPVYGYSPIEEWTRTNDNEDWKDLANSYYYFSTSQSGEWIHIDVDAGESEWICAGDDEFYKYYFPTVLNRYNKEQLDIIGLQQEVSAVIGLDYYYYNKNCWLHTWASVYPIHKGLTDYSFVRNGDQLEWDAGLIFGVNFNRHFSIFVEGRHLKFWDRPSYQLKTGINYLIF
tara:strand:+ start:497 stop:1576 length:1080 start_codon:yes stop_codon:yes gene_type:complete